MVNGLFIVHRNKCRVWEREQWVLICCTEIFELIRKRERIQDPLFLNVLVQFSVPFSDSCP